MKKNITADDLMYAVATFNADPFCIEDETVAEEVMSEINEHGAHIITDNDERKTALAKLDLPEDSQRIVYCTGTCLFSMDDDEYTYDVEFNNEENTNSKGWRCTLEECQDYIRQYNGTNESYFEDYKGGTVSIRCNETEEVVFETEIK